MSPSRAQKIIPFSLEQHYDIRDYVDEAGRTLETSFVVPDKCERDYQLPPRQAAQLGITGLSLYEMRDPILNESAIENAFVSLEDRKTGNTINLLYHAQPDIWKLSRPGSTKVELRTATDIASMLASRSKNNHLPLDPVDASGITSAGILRSLDRHLRRHDIATQHEKTLYRFSWPTKSLLPDGRNDATMQYTHTSKTDRTIQEVAVASTHSMDPSDTAGTLGLITTYRLEHQQKHGRQQLRRGTGSVIINSHILSEENISLLADVEAAEATEHYERLKNARTHMRDIALRSFLEPSL